MNENSRWWRSRESRGESRRLWLSKIAGQAKSQHRPAALARLGLAFFGPAWPGFWLWAGAGTSLRGVPANSETIQPKVNAYDKLLELPELT